MLFHDRSVSYPWYITDEDKRQATIKLDADALSEDMHELESQLRNFLPRVAQMRVAIQQLVTTLQYAYADPDDPDAIGPDALDIALWHMNVSRSGV